MDYYLRMEGVNLANFVYDTQSLNVVRGGGLLLLYAVEYLQQELSGKGFQLKAVSTGASSGIFSFTAKNDQAALAVKTEAERYLHNHKELQYATIMVDVLPAEDDYLAIREKTLAANRWQQMQSSSVVVPEKSSKMGVCETDLIRPATSKDGPAKNGRGTLFSSSASLRYNFGRTQKQAYYEKITGKSSLPEFTNDLEELSNETKYGNLHHKIAFFYADGNKFGKIQLKNCKDEASQLSFDTQIKDKRKVLLTRLLEESMNLSGMFLHDKLRFETLLWGGDELIFVVPAWQGWWLAERFFSLTAGWRFENTDLTHGASLIFCHHNAPIHRVKNLAWQLAELAKEKDREKNLLAYQVLESFDHLGASPGQYRQDQCPKGVDAKDLIVDGLKLSGTRSGFPGIRQEHPRRQLYKIVHLLYSDPARAAELIKTTLNQLEKTGLQNEIKELKECFGTGIAFWLHLIELWDYVEPEVVR